MNRRTFLERSALGGAALVASQAACTAPPPPEAPPPADQPVARAAAGASPDDFELHEATIDGLQEAMRAGRLTARGITERYLARIEALNRQGPELRAIIETNPDALAIADQLDAERKAGTVRGPLHGIPIALKDNIDTHDRMTTTAGSLALEGSIPPQDAVVAQKLRDAGAILLAKANMSEWAYWRGLKATSGWSARGGQCRNPYALDRNPCGSSSGSGTAASANLVAFTIGTETGGSIMCPSSINGVVGVKPTVGLWSRAGIIPISHSQDSAGPMARTVRDAAIALGVACGLDPRDAATAASEGRTHADYTTFLDPAGLKGARIGVARSFPGFDERVLKVFDEAIAAMQSAGAEIVDPADLPQSGDVFQELPTIVLNYEFKANINRYFASLGPNAPVKSLAELIAFNEAHRDQEMRYFGQERLIASEATTSLDAPEYRRALAAIQRAARGGGIDLVMTRHRLDAIVAPTMGPAWPTDPVLGDRLDGGSSAGPAAIAGYPDISVPMGFVSGLPVGISFFGRAWSEGPLLRLAYAFEQATTRRRSPQFLPALA